MSNLKIKDIRLAKETMKMVQNAVWKYGTNILEEKTK